MVPSEPPGLEVMLEQWNSCGVDAIVFGSSEMARAYARRLGDPPRGAALVAWGDFCAETVSQVFGREAVTMTSPDIDGLIAALKFAR
jgi:uroporphyrinogen-III synthase